MVYQSFQNYPNNVTLCPVFGIERSDDYQVVSFRSLFSF